jgi:hypothetical protein
MRRLNTAEIPRGPLRLLGMTPEPFVIVIELDGYPYAELGAKTAKTFKAAYDTWRRVTVPTLFKSHVRYFAREKDDVYEFKP